MSLTEQEKAQALIYADGGAMFYFLPSQQLSNMVMKDAPETKEINNSLKIFIVEREAIKITTEMVVKYCRNELGKMNTWLLDNGDIKVVPEKIQIN